MLKLDSADQQIGEKHWHKRLRHDEVFDFIVLNLPFGMERESTSIGRSTLKVRRNWVDLARALRHLDDGGLCLAVVEPSAFGLAEGPAYLDALETEGYRLSGLFDTPQNVLSNSSIGPVLAAITRGSKRGLFVAELVTPEQAAYVASAFLNHRAGDSLASGMELEENDTFSGFANLKAKLQLEKLETQYKQYKTCTLEELATEIVSVRSGGRLEHKPNAVYIPMLGTSPVTHNLSDVAVKHQNVFQVVLEERANSAFVSAFFRSDLGLLVLRSMTQGAFIPRISKSALKRAQIALPSLRQQEEIVLSHERLGALSVAIDKFQRDLALNPGNASAIRRQVETMLEQIGGLTEAERILTMAREGESATVEFKESFSLDVRKGTKEKHIEHSSLKTIAAFLNTSGGTLLIGVADTGEVQGISDEVAKYHKSTDKFMLYFKNHLKARIGEQFYPFVNQRLVDVSGALVLVVACDPSPAPCYLDGSDFFVRTNPATDKLEGPKLVEYVQNHFSKAKSF